MHSCRHLMKSSITRCNASRIASLILALSSSKVAGCHPKYVTLHITPQKYLGLRNHEILVATKNHKSVRLTNMGTFYATSPHSFVQYVIWHHISGTTMMHVCSQRPASSTYLRPWKSLHSLFCCTLLNIKTWVFLPNLFGRDVHRTVNKLRQDSYWTNKIGQVHSLEYNEIPKAFFTPHHRWWCQQGNQGNNKHYNHIKGRNGTLGHCCTVIWDHCWNNICCQWPMFTLL
jgi:hypothetical protein